MELRTFLLTPVVWVLKFWIVILIQALGKALVCLKGLIASDQSPIPAEIETRSTVSPEEIDNLIAHIFLCREVLEVIFKNSDTGRLKKFRLVCKTWNREICCSVARGRGSYLWLSHYDFQITKLNLVDPVQDVKPLHYSGVSFQSADYLLQTYARTLTHLTLQYWVSNIKETLQFPRLKLLRVNYSGYGLDQSAAFFLKIITAAPNLIRLRIGWAKLGAKILEGTPLSSLKQLEIAADPKVLLAAQFPAGLDSLHNLGISTNWTGPETINKIKQALSPFSSRLEILKMGDHDGFPCGIYPSNFLVFPILTTLELERYNPGVLDFSCFPTLEHLIIQHVVANITSCSFRSLSVKTVSLRKSVSTHGFLNPPPGLVPPDVQEAAFVALFLNCPNAQTWELPYANAVSLCRAALASRFSVKSLVLRSSRRTLVDEEKLLHDDRFAFSYLERLEDLEILGLFDECWSGCKCGIRLKAIDLKKMPSLKTLMIRPSYGNKVEEIQTLQGDLRIVIIGSNSLDGKEELLSQANIEFQAGRSSTYHPTFRFWNPLWPQQLY